MSVYRLKRVGLPGVALWLALLWLGLLESNAVTYAAEAPALPEKAVLENFPIFAQQHSLSCEYSSTRMMTAYWNREISEAEFIRSIIFHPNPHVGYRGNIDGSFGGTYDYGIYAEPIARMLETRGFKTKLLVGGANSLKQELALGRPVQVWIIAGMGWGWPFTETHEGLPFRLAGGEHSVVIYGYDKQGVYVADPAYGGRAYYGWETFMRSWGYFDQMALSFWPDTNQTETTAVGGPGVSLLFYRHWLNAPGGGLGLFGLPISPLRYEGSKAYQYFERARLELDLKGPYNQPIMSALLGREVSRGQEQTAPFLPVSPPRTADSLYFSETRHTLSLGFRQFWERYGGLASFGYPISQEFTEAGKTVQYFERVRFEYYPQNPEPYKILLGALGVERMSHSQNINGFIR